MHILHAFPTFAVGGAQTRLALVANRLGGRHRHSIVALDGRSDARTRIADDVPVALLPAPGAGGTILRNLLRHRGVLAAQRPDLLATYNFGAIAWALAARLGWFGRHVHFEDGFEPEEATGHAGRRVLLRRAALTFGAQIVVPSRSLQRIATETWRLPASRIHYVPNGVDPSRFAPVQQQADGPVVIGALSPLRPDKNVGRLLRAFAALNDRRARLRIAGAGGERAALEKLALDLGIAPRVEFVGHVEDAAAFLQGLHVFALSSETEQMPFGVLEAMASALPVVATDVGDIAGMVARENRSFVVAKNDEAAYAGALWQLTADAQLRQGLGDANRARLQLHFTETDMVRAVERVLLSDERGLVAAADDAVPAVG